jgi:hypothetical protein
MDRVPELIQVPALESVETGFSQIIQQFVPLLNLKQPFSFCFFVFLVVLVLNDDFLFHFNFILNLSVSLNFGKVLRGLSLLDIAIDKLFNDYIRHLLESFRVTVGAFLRVFLQSLKEAACTRGPPTAGD